MNTVREERESQKQQQHSLTFDNREKQHIEEPI